jgi:predicted RNA-binding protein YlxR (DUF448 family)
LPTANRKAKNHSIRFTQQEIEEIDAHAVHEGVSRSAYIRKCCITNNPSPRRRVKASPVSNQKSLSKVLGLLGASRLASNINQIAHAINSGRVIVLSPDMEAVIRECRDHLKAIKDALYHALGIKGDP